MPERIDCVMLAAGESRRMGEWKMLLPFLGATMVETSVRRALEACARVILVAGFRGRELVRLFRLWPGVRVIDHGLWREGMYSSVRAGIERVETPRFFVALGDMPLVGAEVYRALLASDAQAVIPSHRGRRGHPVLLSTEAVRAHIRRHGAIGTLRDVIACLTMETVPVPDPGVVDDIDTPEDYREVRDG